ncbi:hypothetical protein [Streptobacillus moniliformis]|uniref:hypothetical protein n=1 Tax=Streptobacillus moniliformis TaxID=34105 RepID=UPI0007E47CA0|nr:hypothetical protein [Streptobacillus moniliformis]QXW65235.1 hypothetical protein KX935_05295 [Streptobacillus moniliformis]
MKKNLFIFSILFLGAISFSEGLNGIEVKEYSDINLSRIELKEKNDIEFKENNGIELKENDDIDLNDVKNTGIVGDIIKDVIKDGIDKAKDYISEKEESEEKETSKEIHTEQKICPPELNGTCLTE